MKLLYVQGRIQGVVGEEERETTQKKKQEDGKNKRRRRKKEEDKYGEKGIEKRDSYKAQPSIGKIKREKEGRETRRRKTENSNNMQKSREEYKKK